MKKIYFTVTTIILVFLTESCNDDVIHYDQNQSSEYSILPVDSLDIKYDMQSNPELMLSDRIINNNSIFILDLSLEEAKELKISKEIYEYILIKVSELNE